MILNPSESVPASLVDYLIDEEMASNAALETYVASLTQGDTNDGTYFAELYVDAYPVDVRVTVPSGRTFLIDPLRMAGDDLRRLRTRFVVSSVGPDLVANVKPGYAEIGTHLTTPRSGDIGVYLDDTDTCLWTHSAPPT